MNGFNSSEYYRRRAGQASALADAASMPAVKAIHQAMATRYVALAEAGEAPAVRLVLSLAF